MKRVRPSIDAEDASPAFQLVALVWAKTAFKSWIRLNHTMMAALSLAVRGGLAFDVMDIEKIHSQMNGGRWFSGGEWIYREAVEFGNTSAALSYEEWVGRHPFILDGRRLFVGAEVDMKYLAKAKVGGSPRCALVTSFNDDDLTVTVCTYEAFAPIRSRGDSLLAPGGKPKARIRLSLAEVRDLERTRVKALRAARASA